MILFEGSFLPCPLERLCQYLASLIIRNFLPVFSDLKTLKENRKRKKITSDFYMKCRLIYNIAMQQWLHFLG